MHESPAFMQPDRPAMHGGGQMMHGQLLAALSSQPLMIEPGFLGSLLALGDSPPVSRPPSAYHHGAEHPDASYFLGSYDPRTRVNITDDGIAMSRVHGLLVNRGPWLGSIWGMTSYEGLGEQLKRLADDPDVKHIVLDIDSGGGMVAGCWDLMPTIAAVRKKKPVTAVANAWACSAAYAIGAAADHLYVNRSSTTGSIGVVRPHMDMSEALAKHGVRPTMFVAGRMKAAGNGYQRLTSEAAAYIQAGVDEAYEKFVAHVAERRKLDPEAVKATEARVYGPEDACALGLACGIMNFDEVIDLIRNPRKSSGRRTSPPGGTMNNTQSGVGLSAADLEALSASIVAAVKPKPADDRVSRAEAERMVADAAAKAGATARSEERARVLAITSCEAAKGREAAALKMALTTDLSAEQAAGLLADLPKAEAVAAKPASQFAAAMSNPANAANIRPDASAATGSTSARPSMVDRVKARAKSAPRRSNDNDD